MASPTIVTRYRMASASSLLEAMGESLSVIKESDQLTDAYLGVVMGKGADQGGKYRTALAEMGSIAFLRACERWNGRFANDALALVGMKLVPLETAEISDQALSTRLSKLMFEWSIAMEDGRVDEMELARMSRTLIAAGAAIDAKRGKVA